MINYVKWIQIKQELFPEKDLGEATKKCMQTKQFAEALHEVMREQADLSSCSSRIFIPDLGHVKTYHRNSPKHKRHRYQGQ